MDELFDLVPGGRWTLAAVALFSVPGVRRQLRPVAKGAVRMSLAVTDQFKEFVAEAREQTSDLVAEVRSERAVDPSGATAAGSDETGDREGRRARGPEKARESVATA